MLELRDERTEFSFSANATVRGEVGEPKVGVSSPVAITAKATFVPRYAQGLVRIPISLGAFEGVRIQYSDAGNRDSDAYRFAHLPGYGIVDVTGDPRGESLLSQQFPEHRGFLEVELRTLPLLTPGEYQKIRDGAAKGTGRTRFRGANEITDGMGWGEMMRQLWNSLPTDATAEYRGDLRWGPYLTEYARRTPEELQEVCAPIVKATIDEMVAYAVQRLERKMEGKR